MSVVATNELDERIAALRRHRAAHVMGFDCQCGETDATEQPYPTLEQERDAILQSLDDRSAQVRDIVQHRCTYEIHESGEYYHRCPVCGADGNA
jgi:hypothetical protein